MFQPVQPLQPGRTPRTLSMNVADVDVDLRSCGALWIAELGALVVSDLHLEKGSAYASRGQMLPPYDTRAALGRISTLIAELKPATVISLGDSFHDRHARPRMAADDVAQVRALSAQADWIWITGNHDPAPPHDLGGEVHQEFNLGPLVFRHEPSHAPARGEIAGHLHPCARVVGRGRIVRARCFVSDGVRLVMPAYGALTGGLNVLDAAFSQLFSSGFVVGVVGRDGVYGAARNRLAPDNMRRAG